MKAYWPVPSHDGGRELMARYEQLRCEGMQRTMSRELAVFLAEGMCAWMHVWLSLPVETGEGFERRYSSLNASKDEQEYVRGKKLREIVRLQYASKQMEAFEKLTSKFYG